MNEQQLKNYIDQNRIEWHRYGNEVLVMPTFEQLAEFCKFIKVFSFDDGINSMLKDGYIVFGMREICEYYGIEIDNVFIGEDWE